MEATVHYYPFRENKHAEDYDNYDPNMKIVVRGVELLDYTAGGPDFRPFESRLPGPSPRPGLDREERSGTFVGVGTKAIAFSEGLEDPEIRACHLVEPSEVP